MRNSPKSKTRNNSMTSERKIAANRRNAKKSTGPRSAAGRASSGQNARRHGLATGIGADPAFRDDIEDLARLFSKASGRHKIGEFHREAAEAHLELMRIRKFRAGLIKGLRPRGAAATENLAELSEKFAKL